MRKLILLVPAVLALGVAASAQTLKRPTRIDIVTSIDLPASPEAIWTVLSDIKAYPEWNPYHVAVEGELLLGEMLSVKIEKPNGRKVAIKPHVLELEPGKSLVWGGGPRGVFRGEHRFDLETLSAGCTRLHHTEVFAGLFVSFAELSAIEPGYNQMNWALLKRLEHKGLVSGGCGSSASLPASAKR